MQLAGQHCSERHVGIGGRNGCYGRAAWLAGRRFSQGRAEQIGLRQIRSHHSSATPNSVR